MGNDYLYIYGIRTCLSQIQNNHSDIIKIFTKRNSSNKNLKLICDLAIKYKIMLEYEDNETMSSLSLSNKHQGIVMKINQTSFNNDFTLDYYLQSKKTPLILILDSIQDPRNLGSCIRTANAAGVSLIVKRKANSSSITSLVAKTSSGGLNGLHVLETNEIVKIIRKLRENNILVIGTDDSSKSNIFDISAVNQGVAIIVGSEGEGIRISLLGACDLVCQIPIYGTVECLNVSVATGIALFHLRRKLEKGSIVK